MRPDEIERFFAARALGADSLAMAIHVRDDDRLIGTCALSQLDARQRLGAVPHHDRREGRLGPRLRHRGDPADDRPRVRRRSACTGSALSVFSFNERAIRSYRSVGFVVEGRAREAIWREGRWWDEISMSILDSDWEALRDAPARDADALGRDGGGPRPTRRAAGRGGHGRAASGGGDEHARARRPTPPGPTFRELIEAKGHAVDNARAAVARLEAAFAAGDLVRTPALTSSSRDLMLALEQDEGQKLGGKSAEAARFILRAIDRELDNA